MNPTDRETTYLCILRPLGPFDSQHCLNPVKTSISVGPSVAEPDPNPDPYVLGLLDPDPDPLVRGMDPDPDPSITKQK